MGILPSKESHEYPGAFHFAQSGSHAMAILPLTEHFFPSVDSLAFKQLYACRDLQSAKYNFSLVSPQIVAKYRARAIEKLRTKLTNGEANMEPPKDWLKPRPCLARKKDADDENDHTDATNNSMNVADREIDTAETNNWVEVDTINEENFEQFFRTDTRCISPEESEWPFPHSEEELCRELQHPNPSAHWRTHDAAKKYLQLGNKELELLTTTYATSATSPEMPSSHGSSDQQGTPLPHSYQNLRDLSKEFGITPEAVAEYADHEREYVDKFFSRSPEALYSALVVEPNKGFLVDTNKEMCEIYAAETRWKEARKVVRAYRRQCKEDAAAAGNSNKNNTDDDAKITATSEPAVSQDTQPESPQRRISKEEAEEAAKVPPPALFLRPAPQVIVVRIQREEEEATRAKYLAEQQQKQKKRSRANFDDETASAGSRSARSHATSAQSPVSKSISPMPEVGTPKSPTPSSTSYLHIPTSRYHRFEDDDRYKDGRIHLVEEDGVLYMFAYNTAYVDPRRTMKEQKHKSMDSLEQRTTTSSSAAGDEDRYALDDLHTGTLTCENRQTSSFYHTVDSFGSEEPQNAPVERSKKPHAPRSNDTKSATAAAAATPGAEEELEDDNGTALAAKRGGLERQQDTTVFVDDAEPRNIQNAPESVTDEDESYENDDGDDGPRHRRRHAGAAHQGSASVYSESTPSSSPKTRPREVNQLQLFTAAPYILPICAVRVVGCNGYTESSCRGTPWLRGTDDDPEEDAYIESLPVRPPVMSGGGFIDANIGDKILSRAFLLGLQVFRNVCLDAGLPETLTRPFWTLGLLSNIPLLQISREMRFRMRAAAAEVQLGFQGLRDMIKGTENDLQSYIYGFADILPYLKRASQARLQKVADEEAARDSGEGEKSDDKSPGGHISPHSLHLLLSPEKNEPYTVPTRASQPIVQRKLRFPRRQIEFYTQLTIRGNQYLSRVRTESQQSFFHLIAEATAPVSTSLFMKPLELNMYDYGGAIRLHLVKNKVTGETEKQALPPPKNVDQLISDHQRRVQLRRLAKQAEDNADSASTAASAATGSLSKATEVEGSSNTRSNLRKSAKEHEGTAPPPYLVFTIVQPSAWAKGPSLKHYQRIMQGPDGQSSKEGDQQAAVDLTDTELMSMCDPAATAAADGATPVTRCTCYAAEGDAQPFFAPHQYLYDDGTFVDGDMVVYNIHAGRWEHFEYFHRQQLARRRAQRERQKQLRLQHAQSDSVEKNHKEDENDPQAQAGGRRVPSASAVSVQDENAEGKYIVNEISDDDEEDIHQEDILLCWIKRRLQSATMRNRQDPGWLRDNEDHIVQEGRYYIWGFEHDDQHYFYGLIPKFAKEKKTKRHNDKATNPHTSSTSMNSHHHRHGGAGGGGSSVGGTPSMASISPSMSNVSAHELRRMPNSGHRNNNGDGGSGRNRNNNSPSAHSARSSQSLPTNNAQPRSHHKRHGNDMGGGGGGTIDMKVNDLNGTDFGENSSGCHEQADAQGFRSYPEPQTRPAQRSPVSNSNPNSQMNSRRSMKGGEGGNTPAKAVANSPINTTPVAVTGGDVPRNANTTTMPNPSNSNSSSAVRQGRATRKPLSKASAFMTATVAKEAEGFSSSSVATPGGTAITALSGGGGGQTYPPRTVSAPLQSAAFKGAAPPANAFAHDVASAVGGNASSHSPSSSSNEGTRVRGGRLMANQDISSPLPMTQQQQQQQQQPPQSFAEPAPYLAQRQQPEYASTGGNHTTSSSNNRHGQPMHTSNPAPQQQQQQQQQQSYPSQRGGPKMNSSSSNNGKEWYAARGSSDDHSPPPPPIAGGNFDAARGYMNPSPSQKMQQQQQQHLHPPTVYMNTNTANLLRNAQPQQLPQPRRAQQQQQQQQQGPLPQMGPQAYPQFNPQAQRTQPQQQPYVQQQHQMGVMSASGMHGGNLSPLQQPPPPMPMNTRRRPNNNNTMSGAGTQGGYADPSSHPTPNPSFPSPYYPEVPLPQQQLPPPPPLSSQHLPHGNTGADVYSAPPQPMSAHNANTANPPYGMDTANNSMSGNSFTSQGFANPHQQQQPSYNIGSNMGHSTGAMYGDVGLAPQVAVSQQQPQPQMNMQMRVSSTMPIPQSMRNTSMNAMPGGPQPPMGGGGNPPYPPRQMMANPSTSAAASNAHVAPTMPAGNCRGNDMGMYNSNSSSNNNTSGLAGTPLTSPDPSNTGGGWANQPLPMYYNTNNSNNNNSSAPASSGRAGGPVGNEGSYPTPNVNAYPLPAPLNTGGAGAAIAGRNSAYPAWGSVSSTASNQTSPQQPQQGPYPSQSRDTGYVRDSYNTAGGVGNNNNNNSSTTNNSRLTTSPYPQQYAPQQPPQQQQQQPYPAQFNDPSHQAPMHNHMYSKSAATSPSLSFAAHPPMQQEQQQQQQQHFPSHSAGNTNNNSNNPYGYGGSTSPRPQQDPVQQQHPASASSSMRTSGSMNVPPQHHLATSTGSTTTLIRHVLGGGQLSNYPPSTGSANASRQQQPHQHIQSVNASGVFLHTSPSPQHLQQQRHQQQQGVVSPTQAYSVQPSPAPPQQHSSPYLGPESAQQPRSGDSCGENGSYDLSSSPGQQPRFAHNPYAMQ